MKFWIGVVSNDHVKIGIKEGFAQFGHGKLSPIKRLGNGDIIIYYSPREEMNVKSLAIKGFTAIGVVEGKIPYNPPGPARVKVKYLKTKKYLHIHDVLDNLTFIKNKKRWGILFRRSLFEINKQDFIPKMLFSLQDVFLYIELFILAYTIKFFYDVIYLAYFSPLRMIPGPKHFALTKYFVSKKHTNGMRWKWLQYELFPEYGPVVRIAPQAVIIADPDMIKEILVIKDLPKNQKYDQLRTNLSIPTLLTTRDKTFHKKRRQIVAPAFSFKYLNSIEPLIHNCVKPLLIKFDEMVDQNQNIVNIYEMIHYCVLDITGETIFGGSFRFIETGNHPLPHKIFQELRRMIKLGMFPFLKPFIKQDPYILNFMTSLIKNRRQEDPERKDLLGMLLNASERSMSDIELHYQAIEFLIAGSDTSSFSSAMTMIKLIQNPDKLDTLFKEIDESFPEFNIDKLPSHDKLKQLPYLNAVINETLRLHPINYDIGPGRITIEDTIIGDYFFPKGTTLAVNAYRLHHSSKYWGDDVEEFVPERWLNPERIPKDCFLPFSAGTRNCIGQNFAMMVIRIIVATLIQKYKFEDILNQDMDIVHYLTPSLKTKQYNVKIYSRN
ncbi:unnamed protein product [Rhizophagus irregularis]|nr:unnamed protein product [Rhizophagus irregularis]